MSVQIYSNNSRTSLASNIGAGDLVIPTLDSTSFPSIGGTDWMLVTLEYGSTIEIIKLIAPGKIGNNLIVDPAGRGWEGTTPSAFLVNTRVEGRITSGTINNVISMASNAVAAEANTRSAADVSEANTRAAADTALQNSITSESNTRSSADNTLQNNITSESNTRIAADNTLQTNINSEASARTNADTTLQNNINAEANTRANAVTVLTGTSVQAGTIIHWPTTVTPTGGYIQLLSAVQFLPNASYPALYNVMASAGFPWGAGTGTFGIPWVKVGYGLVQGTPGSDTIGQVISHSHTSRVDTGVGTGGQFNSYTSTFAGNTGSTGGSANFAAGTNITYWIKY